MFLTVLWEPWVEGAHKFAFPYEARIGGFIRCHLLDHRTLQTLRCGEPDRDAGGLGGNAKCDCDGEFSLE